jgi:hypothetical protein
MQRVDPHPTFVVISLTLCLTNCILRLAFAYVTHLRFLLLVYLLSMPLALVESLGWYVLCSWYDWELAQLRQMLTCHTRVVADRRARELICICIQLLPMLGPLYQFSLSFLTALWVLR